MRSQQPVEQLDVDHIVELVDPEGLEQMVLVIRCPCVSRAADPCLQGRENLVGVPRSQLDLDPVPHSILGLLQQVEQSLDRLAGDLHRLEQRPAFIGHPVNAAVSPVAAGIAKVVLHVADDRVLPLQEVDRTVRPDLDVGRAEVGVGRATGSAPAPRP